MYLDLLNIQKMKNKNVDLDPYCYGICSHTEASIGEARAKVKFKTPFTLETVFGPGPGSEDFLLFTMNRGVNLKSLSEEDKVLWKRTWTENRVLYGYLVFAVVSRLTSNDESS